MVKILAQSLEVPIYVLTEHLIQLGAKEVAELVQDEALKDQLCRHLVRDHLLTPITKPQSEPISRRLYRLKNAMNLVELLETKNTPEEQRLIITELLKGH
jgi:uncharacterized membrane-anchored protein YjiN (DUF445 family)